jgi:hypothetical protein
MERDDWNWGPKQTNGNEENIELNKKKANTLTNT